MWNSNSHNPPRQPMNFSSFPHEICSYCNIPISISEAEQWNHLMLCHQDLTIGALRCNKCKKQFPNRSALLNHLLFTRNHLKCPICSTYYASHQELMRHLYQKHSGYYKRHIQSNNSEPSRPFNQVILPQTSRPTPQDILTNPQGKRDYNVCELCANVSAQKAEYYKHMRQEHTQYVSENWFQCSNCQLAYPDKRTLKAHSNLYSCRYTVSTLAPMLGDVDLDSIDFQLHWLR